MRNIPRQRPQRRPMLPMRIFFRHLQAGLFALGRLLRTPFASSMTISVIAVSLALPALLFLVLTQFKNITDSWQHGTQISLFLEQDISEQRIDELRRDISLRADVMYVNYISPDQGLRELQESAGFADIYAQLPQNPLPAVLEVYPTSLSGQTRIIEVLLQDLAQLPEVETSKLDMDWLLRLSQMVSFAQRAALSLILLLSLGVLLIVSNTIRLATYNRRHEIEVLKLIGATHRFIRRPFLYTGLFYGLFGATIAWLMVALMRLWLLPPLQRLVGLYESDFYFQGLGLYYGLPLLLFGAVLGIMGAWFAVSRHIARIEPH